MIPLSTETKVGDRAARATACSAEAPEKCGCGVRTSRNSPRSSRAGHPGAARPGSPDIRPSASPVHSSTAGDPGGCAARHPSQPPRDPCSRATRPPHPCRLCSALPADSYCAPLSAPGDSVIRPHVLWGFTPAFLEDAWALTCAPGTKGQK